MKHCNRLLMPRLFLVQRSPRAFNPPDDTFLAGHCGRIDKLFPSSPFLSREIVEQPFVSDASICGIVGRD